MHQVRINFCFTLRAGAGSDDKCKIETKKEGAVKFFQALKKGHPKTIR